MIEVIDDVALYSRLQPDRLALRDLARGNTWTYRELDIAIARFAATLVDSYGLAGGERVSVLSINRAETIILHWACARAGMIFVPLNWRLSPAEIEWLIEDCEPALLMGDDKLDPIQSSIKFNMDEFVARAAQQSPLPHREYDRNQPSLILYTSGTSGKPKGAMLSENNIQQVALNSSILGRINNDSVLLCEAPLFHTLGLTLNVRPVWYRGGTLLLSDGFDPEVTLARLSDPELGITHTYGVPQMAMMMRQQESFDPDKLRHLTGIFTGGAPHPEANIRQWLADDIAIIDGFGMSEAGTVFGMPIEKEVIASKAGSVGLPTPNVKARIVDDKDVECKTGMAGELLLKGDNITLGYWRNPEATQAAFTDDGWFRTGDIAYQDEDGFYYLVDRKKDMYISGGENVYPAEVEAAFAGMDGIVEAAVVGVPDEKWGEVGHLAVVLKPGVTLDLEQVLDYLGSRLARYKLPKRLSCIDALPRTGSGKVQKNELRDMLVKMQESTS